MDRRTFLSAAPLASVPALAAGAAPADPLVGLLEEWRRARKAIHAAEDARLDHEFEAAEAKEDHFRTRIKAATPVSMAGAAAQLDFAIEDELVGGEYFGADRVMFRNLRDFMASAAA